MTKITDENDNLIDVPDEYTKTPGGYCKLDVDLDDDVIAGLINIWATKNLHPASLELFREKCELNDPADAPVHALYDAIVNDTVIEALTQQIARQESELDANSADV